MYEYVKGLNKMKRIAVAGADNLDSLKAFRKLKDLGIADFILVGPAERIDKLAHENNIDISDFEIVDKKKDAEIARMILAPEPDGNNPNACHIKFRLPDGEKMIERRQ